MSDMDFKKIFDAHYPVIAAAKRVRDYYAGDNDKGIPLICSDPVGELINAINGAEKLYNIVLQAKENEDGRDTGPISEAD